ncbi:MAG: LamG-like jellyroll fold domain-containing protein [Prolixibacteraceae bacterium]
MKHETTKLNFFLLTGILLLFIANVTTAQEYSWQKPNATVVETGDLQWDPSPFQFEEGSEVRYIDYENGNDGNDGLTKETAWKHHPWDSRAAGKAASASGAITYVFKRGVTYRFTKAQEVCNTFAGLNADESGTEGNPIRLTSSPDWGSGEAILAGSVVVPQEWQKANSEDVPEGMDTTGVWYINTAGWDPREDDVTYAWVGNGTVNMTVLFEVVDGAVTDLHLARDPDWQEPGANFATDYWHRWDGQKQVAVLDENCNPTGKTKNRPFDADLEGYDCNYFNGGTLWSSSGTFIGTPTPATIEPGDYNPETGSLVPNHFPIQKGTRYMIENLPQFLDAPGEFYYDADWSQNSGRLFLRLSENRSPNETQIELAVNYTTLEINDKSHIHLSGLTFTRNGFNGNTAAHSVDIRGNCTNIVVKNCKFNYLSNNGVHINCDGDDDVMDNIVVSDNDFYEVKGHALRIIGRSSNNTEKDWVSGGELEHVDVLRNRVQKTGFRHVGNQWSNVAAVGISYPNTGEIAGNIIIRSFGSGLVVQGGKGGGTDAGAPGFVVPMTRILVHHNKIEHAALGVNDYGGLALWQGGPIYSWSNITGNSVGHLPNGLFNLGTTNLSYPLYLDGAFKMYNFNNIIWGRKYDTQDPYTSTRAAYFNVFGYMNQFVNNTIVGSGIGFGGTSGNRNDMNGNLMADVTQKFISSNHGGNPSLIGGGDDATSGIDGAGTLAYANNYFHGDAIAGTLVTTKRGAEKDVEADAIVVMQGQMQNYPLREGSLGADLYNELPIKKSLPLTESPSTSEADFRLAENSAAIDNGIEYFIPWSLHATVGEWYFNKDNRNPAQILDYHFYMTEAYFERKTYSKLPAFELVLDSATVEDYVMSPSESWTAGAFLFDGKRYAKVSHLRMTDDIRLTINDWWNGKANNLPPAPWSYPEPTGGYDANENPKFGDDQVMTYPGEYRKTLDMDDSNMLIEAIFRIDSLSTGDNTVIAGKHDGSSGYQLYITSTGNAGFKISSEGSDFMITSAEQINDNQWHHVLAEIDRGNGRMSIYIDGTLSSEKTTSVSSDASLSNSADFIVGKDGNSNTWFYGAVDFLRVCQGTLEDSKTTIEELYEWQTKGPVKHDFAGNKPKGRRDAGAVETANTDTKVQDILLAWDFAGEGETTTSQADVYHEAISTEENSGIVKMGEGLSPTAWSWPGGFTFEHEQLTLEAAITANDYVEFAIVPKEGEVIDVTGITMNAMNQVKGDPRKVALFTNRLPYEAGNEIVSATLPRFNTVRIELEGLTDISDTLIFRMYYFGVEGGLGGIHGKEGYDMVVQGVVKDYFQVSVKDSIQEFEVKTYGTDPASLETHVFDAGQSLKLTGSGYKMIDLMYEVTPYTVLGFDYSAMDEGTIQGILFDTDSELQEGDDANAIQLYGSDNWAKRQDYLYSGSGTQEFKIPLGDYFTGNFNTIVFLAKDNPMQLQEQIFSNMKIYEDTSFVNSVFDRGYDDKSENTVQAWPNPFREKVTINSEMQMKAIEVVDMVTGRIVKQQNALNEYRARISMSDVRSGNYIISVTLADGARQFVKVVKID